MSYSHADTSFDEDAPQSYAATLHDPFSDEELVTLLSFAQNASLIEISQNGIVSFRHVQSHALVCCMKAPLNHACCSTLNTATAFRRRSVCSSSEPAAAAACSTSAALRCVTSSI